MVSICNQFPKRRTKARTWQQIKKEEACPDELAKGSLSEMGGGWPSGRVVLMALVLLNTFACRARLVAEYGLRIPSKVCPILPHFPLSSFSSSNCSSFSAKTQQPDLRMTRAEQSSAEKEQK